MNKDGRPAFDLLREWIANDQPVYRPAEEVVRLNREHALDYGAGLRDLILDVRSNPSGYRNLCKELGKTPDYAKMGGYPVNDGAAKWTMRQISDREFGEVDWTKLADDLFGELHNQK